MMGVKVNPERKDYECVDNCAAAGNALHENTRPLVKIYRRPGNPGINRLEMICVNVAADDFDVQALY